MFWVVFDCFWGAFDSLFCFFTEMVLSGGFGKYLKVNQRGGTCSFVGNVEPRRPLG